MRLFVAAELPDALLDALSETSALLRGQVRGRFVGPDLFHVTLAFLGEVPAAQADNVARLVAASCSDAAPFSTTLAALGTFGRPSSAVLWQGFDEGRKEWSQLSSDVRSSLRDGGYAFDTKGFIPHVTLMRKADVTHGRLPMPVVERGEVQTVSLFMSDLSGVRPRYSAIERICL